MTEKTLLSSDDRTYIRPSRVKKSVRGEDSLGNIGLKEKVGFQLFVELRGRE